MSVSLGQGCTWLKTLGLLCVLEPGVNLNEMADDRKCPWEHMSRAIPEQVRVPWSESSTSSSLRKLRGSPQAALTTPWPPHYHLATTVGCTPLVPHTQSWSVPVLSIPFSVLDPRFSSLRSPHVPLSLLAPRGYPRMAQMPFLR